MPDELLDRLRRFKSDAFPQYQDTFRGLVDQGQHPTTLFIGCSDSRLVPYLLTGAGPGELFLVRNVGALVPPWDRSRGYHGTAAAIEFAVLSLDVQHVVVCGHSHCGAMRALYEDPSDAMPNLNRWLDFARDAALPVTATEEALRRTEQRSIVLQLERLVGYPMVARGVQQGRLFLHGWHYVIEEGRILVFDVERGEFVPTDVAIAEQQPAPDPAPYQLQ